MHIRTTCTSVLRPTSATASTAADDYQIYYDGKDYRMAQYTVPRIIISIRLTFCKMPFAVSLCLLLWPQARNNCVILRLLSFLKREGEVAFEIALLQTVNP